MPMTAKEYQQDAVSQKTTRQPQAIGSRQCPQLPHSAHPQLQPFQKASSPCHPRSIKFVFVYFINYRYEQFSAQGFQPITMLMSPHSLLQIPCHTNSKLQR